MKHFLSLYLGLVLSAQLLAQNNTLFGTSSQHKGSFYVFWGYNRDWYSKSTISFKNTSSDNYNFTFHDAHASDKPDMQNFYKLDQLTIPQYNLHLGYFFTKRPSIGVELSWDHLKYVVNDNQWINVTGYARERQLNGNTLVTPDFVHLQHTNGNNYAMASIMKRAWLLDKKNFQIYTVGKAGAGLLWSYTISTVLGNDDHGYFHFHGFVGGTELDLRVELFRYFFIQGSMQGALANYTNTRLGGDHKGISKQHFFSLQAIWGAGISVPIGK